MVWSCGYHVWCHTWWSKLIYAPNTTVILFYYNSGFMGRKNIVSWQRATDLLTVRGRADEFVHDQARRGHCFRLQDVVRVAAKASSFADFCDHVDGIFHDLPPQGAIECSDANREVYLFNAVCMNKSYKEKHTHACRHAPRACTHTHTGISRYTGPRRSAQSSMHTQ